MPAVTTLAMVGLGLAAAGTGANVYGQTKQAAASKQAERIRQRQMRVQADRERRQAIREGMQARAMANTNLSNQGGAFGSAQGGLSQVVSNAGQRVSDTNVNQNLGEALFRANDKLSQGKMISGIGSSVAALGTQMIGSADQINRVFAGANGQAQLGEGMSIFGGVAGGRRGFGMGAPR
jgi:hypothetical protein